jgi:hypothetical protein
MPALMLRKGLEDIQHKDQHQPCDHDQFVPRVAKLRFPRLVFTNAAHLFLITS